MKVGFIGLGNAGGKLAGSLLRNGFDLTVLDLDNSLVNEFIDRGASSSNSPREMAELCDVVILVCHHQRHVQRSWSRKMEL